MKCQTTWSHRVGSFHLITVEFQPSSDINISTRNCVLWASWHGFPTLKSYYRFNLLVAQEITYVCMPIQRAIKKQDHLRVVDKYYLESIVQKDPSKLKLKNYWITTFFVLKIPRNANRNTHFYAHMGKYTKGRGTAVQSHCIAANRLIRTMGIVEGILSVAFVMTLVTGWQGLTFKDWQGGVVCVCVRVWLGE